MGLKSLSTFDPDFARAFLDGRFYEGLDHAEALRRVKCPLLVLHGDWFRHPKYGLVGAMDNRDAARIQQLAPQVQYRKISGANHVIHMFKPTQFIEAVDAFAAHVELLPRQDCLRLSEILGKLSARNRAAAVQLARENGWRSPGCFRVFALSCK